MGYIETRGQQMARAPQSTYQRHGTLNLFAALNVATDHIKRKSRKRKHGKTFSSLWVKCCWMCLKIKRCT